MALSKIERLRYGDTNQNYFWISDLQPKMVMHPYSKEMIGTDLSQYIDSDGTRIFLEFIQVASGKNEGFLNHTWHTKYSDQKVVSKLSYVKRFEPWGWIVGTGVFLDDVQRKTKEISNIDTPTSGTHTNHHQCFLHCDRTVLPPSAPLLESLRPLLLTKAIS